MNVPVWRQPGGREDVIAAEQEPALNPLDVASQGTELPRRRNGETSLRQRDLDVGELELEVPNGVERLEEALLGAEHHRAPAGVLRLPIPVQLGGGADEGLEIAAGSPPFLGVDPQCREMLAERHRGSHVARAVRDAAHDPRRPQRLPARS